MTHKPNKPNNPGYAQPGSPKVPEFHFVSAAASTIAQCRDLPRWPSTLTPVVQNVGQFSQGSQAHRLNHEVDKRTKWTELRTAI